MTGTVAANAVFGRIESFVGDMITDQLLQFGAHTRPELALLLSVIEPGDFVFDVGARIGTFSVPIATQVGPSRKVLAIEALTTNFDVLARNITSLGLNCRVSPICTAIGTPGSSYHPHFIPQNTGAPFFTQVSEYSPIPTTTLDDLASAIFFPRILKLDIDGMELIALRGASKLLSRFPILYIELNNDALARFGSTVDEMDTFLSALGYKFFRNVGERNAAHDHYVVREVDRLNEGGSFYDVLSIHVSDARLKNKINESRRLGAR
jgi:FkbM family methyltransferase